MDPVDIPDPTDWLRTSVPDLQALESSLRCQVCKEYFDGPMITSCGHTFCSLCIRRTLTSTRKCPTCMSTDEESKLRRNNLVQDLMECFKKVRGVMLEQLVKKEPVEEEAGNAFEGGQTDTQTSDVRRQRKRLGKQSSFEYEEGDEEVSDRRKGKRRRHDDDYEDRNGVLRSYENDQDRPRRSTRTSSQRTAASIRSSQTPIVIDDSDQEFDPSHDEYTVSDAEDISTPKPKRKQTAHRAPSLSENSSPIPPGMMPCPMCNVPMRMGKQLETHASSCNGIASPPAQVNGSSLISPVKKAPIQFLKATKLKPYTKEEKEQQRIPKPNYAMIKESDLRKRLEQAGIKIYPGEKKPIFISRHTEWINMWNSNLDSEEPKPKAQLVKEFDAYVRSQMNQKKSIVQDKEFDRGAWAGSHTTEFDSLIAQARLNAKKKKIDDKKEAQEDNQPQDAIPPGTAEINGIGSPDLGMQEV